MKRIAYAAVAIVVILTSFVAGGLYSKRQPSTPTNNQSSRKILYYTDPMNPGYKSDKPGLAPCGMKLEPVYADSDSTASSESSSYMPPGAVKISADKQQLLGVKIGTAEKKSVIHTVHLLGRVAVDERRIYRINAAVDGWIRDVYNNTVGSIVKKNESLASFYAPDFLAAEQAYIYAISAMDRFVESGNETEQQMVLTKSNIQQYKDALSNLGMGDSQIEEIRSTRKYTENIRVTSPVTGFVLSRNISPGERFERGKELYRIADLSHVWLLADIFENETQYFKPGIKAKVTLTNQNKTYHAIVSDIPPIFDPASRTLKIRLEAENPGLVLRPDMFVDVDLPVSLPPAIVLPAEAVVYSGERRMVFIAKGSGLFEPRMIETGWHFGGEVEVVKGLEPGERVVISGNFLVDSESRLKAAAAGVFGTTIKDPVCSMHVDKEKAEAAGRTSTYQGKTYYFCSDKCKHDFELTPEHYLDSAGHNHTNKNTASVKSSQGQEAGKVSIDPICNMKVDEKTAREAGYVSQYNDKTYYFCSDECKIKFDKASQQHAKKLSNAPSASNGASNKETQGMHHQ